MDFCSGLDVCQAPQSAPDDGVAWRGIGHSCEITAEPRELCDVHLQGVWLCASVSTVSDEVIENRNFLHGEGNGRSRIRRGAAHHGHLLHSPVDNAKESNQRRETFSRAQFGVFGSATGFQYVVKELDFPEQGIPGDLLNRFFK